MSKGYISVCMAVFNGEKFLKKQIDSILIQLENYDELIIVDDCSTDNSKEIILSFKDERIKYYFNETNLGVNKNFEKAINIAQNEFIFLADQDDIWPENRIKSMILKLMNSNKSVIAGNQEIIDNNGNLISDILSYDKLNSQSSEKTVANLIGIFTGRLPYIGSAMAFKKEFKKLVLPLPENIESHDLWIAKAGILSNKIIHIDDTVLLRRVHGENISLKKRKIWKKIFSRLIFLYSLLELKKRVYKINFA